MLGKSSTMNALNEHVNQIDKSFRMGIILNRLKQSTFSRFIRAIQKLAFNLTKFRCLI
jgi:hypothetical protein